MGARRCSAARWARVGQLAGAAPCVRAWCAARGSRAASNAGIDARVHAMFYWCAALGSTYSRAGALAMPTGLQPFCVPSWIACGTLRRIDPQKGDLFSKICRPGQAANRSTGAPRCPSVRYGMLALDLVNSVSRMLAVGVLLAGRQLLRTIVGNGWRMPIAQCPCRLPHGRSPREPGSEFDPPKAPATTTPQPALAPQTSHILHTQTHLAKWCTGMAQRR